MRFNRDFPLITSLAPKLSRLGSGGEEIGTIYQNYCVDSWLQSGFKVYSLNTAAEIDQLKHTYIDVNFIEAPRDGRELVGRPLVFIADMVSALRDQGYKQCGIINSDIYMTPTPSLIDLLVEEIPGSCVFGHRIDVKKIGDAVGTSYWAGFDFFFFETERFDTRAFDPFLQGAPWWDYGLPLLQATRGLELKRFDTPIFYHLLHDQKWNTQTWCSYYTVLRRMLTECALDALDPVLLGKMSGAEALRFLIGEGSFVSNYFTPHNEHEKMPKESIDTYIRAFAFYCLDLISSMSVSLRLPSDDQPLVPIAELKPSRERLALLAVSDRM